MSKRVLIAYRSRFGSTEEISKKFKQTLEEKGFNVDLVDLKFKKRKDVEITNYSGVLIGSGIRVGRWTKEAKVFLKNNVTYFNNNIVAVGVYLSSGEASNPDQRPVAVKKYLEDVFEEVNLSIGENLLYDAFGGVFDLSQSSNLSWMNKRMLNMVAEEDPNIVRNERRDYRDWDQINDFIENFIQLMGD